MACMVQKIALPALLDTRLTDKCAMVCYRVYHFGGRFEGRKRYACLFQLFLMMAWIAWCA